ncbi:hypothetical protein JQK15_13635 [Sphingobium sp. BHU LFT2]|uniref:phage head spike fiber domain-containing protein n=1 Tax=Sphingobium sp. BHU LFT2 TaxID=2807634 RepID=UPI001BE60C49|nr:hypothetical protein [Sphingobium sp. BHU LFT2]MBT2244581.1 hypothetical protein [Sphingobium sp. BHU LFT2]
MAAFVTYPETFTIISAAAQTTAPAVNLLTDDVGLIYRSTTLTPTLTVLSGSPTPIDTVALVNTNLRCFDAVRIRIGDTQTDVDGTAPVDIQMPAWSGIKSSQTKAMTVLRLPAPVAGKYVRIDITATGHPDGYVQIGRVVIGSSATNQFGAIGQDVEVTINDGSESYDYRGNTGWDKYAKTQSFKAPVNWITEQQYRRDWHRTLTSAGNSSAVLFVPSYELKTNVNLLRDSQTMASANGWTTSGSPSWVRNADYAPDGSLTASVIGDTSTTVQPYALGSASIPTDVTTYTVSVFVKKQAGPIVRLVAEVTGGTAATASCSLDPATGASSAANSVVDAGDYWRVYRSVNNSGANTNARIRCYPAYAEPGSVSNPSAATAVGSNTFAAPQITAGSGLVDWCPTSQTATADTHFAAMEQNDAVFGFISKATPKWSAPYWWNIDLTVTSTSL